MRGSWFAAVIWISAAGCDGALGEDCPAGSLFHYPLCVPEWVTHPCDEDEDDFLDDTCGGDDCGPTDPRVHPRAVEVCNGVDDDCDGFTDEGVPAVDWYWDEDGDGWGGGAPEGRQCAPPDGAVERGGDCDDGNPDRHPGAEERCNSIDDDCDGFTDEGRVTRYYRDADGDGFGTPFDRVDGCDLPAGFVPTAGDCDDGNGDVRPDQLEFFAAAGGSAGFDYDCDGAETRERSSVAGDCSACTAAVGGWAGAVVPGCGETGTWLTCRYDVGTGCHEQFRLAGEVQRCR